MPTRNAVCLCTDRNMLIPALFVAQGVRAASAKSRIPIDVVIVAEAPEVSDLHRAWMAGHGILLHDQIELSSLDAVARIQERLSVATLTKLLLAPRLADRYDKILYLDADLIIHDDVSQIFALDTGTFALAAVQSGMSWAFRNDRAREIAEAELRALGMTVPYRFFNSGVLYIDVEKWNRADLCARVLAFIQDHRDLCSLPDEHGLNGVLDGAFARLSPIWNMRPPSPNYAVAHQIARPVIVHYAGEDKPWRRFGYRKRLFADLSTYRLYQEFLKETPWPTWLDEQWHARDIRRTIEWELRRITRALRGRPEEPSRRQSQKYINAFKAYCAEGAFVDVEQGIVVREHGALRLRQGEAGVA